MQKASPKVTLLIVPIASPLLIGVYENGILIETVKDARKTSEVLLPLLADLMQRYDIERIVYTRGPGSYMAIKLTYITLKTIQVVHNIPLYGCSGFALNEGRPIKAVGSLYFIKEKETIITKKFEEPVHASYALPHCIHDLALDEESTPEYLLPAV